MGERLISNHAQLNSIHSKFNWNCKMTPRYAISNNDGHQQKAQHLSTQLENIQNIICFIAIDCWWPKQWLQSLKLNCFKRNRKGSTDYSFISFFCYFFFWLILVTRFCGGFSFASFLVHVYAVARVYVFVRIRLMCLYLYLSGAPYLTVWVCTQYTAIL